MDLVNSVQVLAFCFCTVDQSGHDYQVISSMHIDRLIVGVRFWVRLIFFILSCSLRLFSLPPTLPFLSLFFLLLDHTFLYISRSASEQPQRRYNSHKTLWPCEVSANFEIYSRRVYRHGARESTIVNVIAQQQFGPVTSRDEVNLSNASLSASKYRYNAGNKRREVDVDGTRRRQEFG